MIFIKNNITSTNPIRSYVKREGRLTKSQLHGLNNYWIKYGLEYNPKIINFEKIFKRHGPIILDIGVGAGESTINHAKLHPENNYLAVEVHRPGIGQLLNKIESAALKNIKIIKYDVMDILNKQIPNRSLSQVFIFFPDPWPKKRHHKRRLLGPGFLDLIAGKLKPGGLVHIATDWVPYAEAVELLFASRSDFELAETPQRPETKFERRGRSLGHEVLDLVYRLDQ